MPGDIGASALAELVTGSSPFCPGHSGRPLAPVAPFDPARSLSALAAQDLQRARDSFDARQAGMGDKFLNCVEDALDRISRGAEQYQIALLDLRRAPSPRSTTACRSLSCAPILALQRAGVSLGWRRCCCGSG